MQAFGLRKSPKVVDARQIGSGHVEESRRRAGGKQQLVEGERCSAVEDDLVPGGVEADHLRAGEQVDLVLRIPGVVVDEHRLTLRRANEEALGERRPLVRSIRFVTDEVDAAREALGAERLCSLGAGKSRADDHECALVRHGTTVLRLVHRPSRWTVCATVCVAGR